MNGSYDDIINLPHHVSDSHPKMPVCDRAAQFSPFAALTGYDAAIREAARLTEDRMELGDDSRAYLDECMEYLRMHLKEHPQVLIFYFNKDDRKAGGGYRSVTGAVKRIDEYGRQIVLQDGGSIALEDIVDMQLIGS